MPRERRGTVLLTGVGRQRSIGAGLAVGLADDGWDLVLSYWAPYDEHVVDERGDHDPADTADIVRFLMSDAGSWVTGQVLYSNGGFRTSG